ncbi:MAG: CRTAC1 family protein [Acidimicrobiia bacterium]|jgi:hypothetical protein
MSRPVRHRGLWLLAGTVVGAALTTGVVILAARTIAGPAPEPSAPPPLLIEETSSGIEHVYDGEFEYFVGGGVAVFDCNDDAMPDVFLAGGSNQAALYTNESSVGGDLRFSREEASSTDLMNVTGAYPIDIDGDEIIDLAVLRVGENVMLRGLGDCRFERANERWGIDGGSYWTAAFSAKWEPGASLPTLVFGNYLRLKDDGARDECEDHQLVRPRDDVYAEPTSLSPGWCALSVLFSDWSRSGERDLRATNDRHYYRDGQEQLWRVPPGESPTLFTGEDGWRTMQIWGMGIASQDVTGDGLPEVFLTSQGDNKLQTLAQGPDNPAYEDIALVLGTTAHRPFSGDTNQPSTAWHAEFDDVNNDGYMDLLVTKGNVDAVPEFAMDDPNNLLIGQQDGGFVEGADRAGFVDFERSRGAALIDLNLDGALDAVVVERRVPVRIWRNTGVDAEQSPLGNWLAVRIRQPAPNVSAIGSWVEVRHGGDITEREISIGGGHAGGEMGWTHFGLGSANNARVRVTWPDGSQSPWHEVEANSFVVIDRETDSAEIRSDLRD